MPLFILHICNECGSTARKKLPFDYEGQYVELGLIHSVVLDGWFCFPSGWSYDEESEKLLCPVHTK